MLSALSFLLLFFSVASTEPYYSDSTDFKFYTGYLTGNATIKSNLFYQLIPALGSSINDPKPLILWLQGGPGCSSQYGSFIEFGPYYVAKENNKLTLKRREVTWSQHYHILLIDNPSDAGFSIPGAAKVIDTKTAMEQVYNALVEFFKTFPALKNNHFYIFGESYAGKYLPYLAYEILTHEEKSYEKHFNFKGIGIGNAWTDPVVQVGSFASYAYAASVIDTRTYHKLLEIEKQGKELIEKGDMKGATVIFNKIESILSDFKVTGGVFMNDFRSFLAHDPVDPIFNHYGLTQDFLNSTEGKKLYNVSENINFNLCNGDINNAWDVDMSSTVIPQLEYVLSRTRVLIFSGADDIECNTFGVLKFIDKMNWPGSDKFRRASKQTWRVNGKVAGTIKTGDNLTFVTVYKAGHYVPYYQPENTLEMVKSFVGGGRTINNPEKFLGVKI